LLVRQDDRWLDVGSDFYQAIVFCHALTTKWGAGLEPKGAGSVSDVG
jgi:hypothetical protein